MISLPRYRSLWEGSDNDEWTNTDLFWMKYLIPAFITLPAFANSIQFLFILFVLLAPVWTRWVLAKETGRGRQNSESGDEIHESETEKTAVYVFKSVSALSDPHSPTHHPMMTPRNTEIRYLSRYFIQRTKLNIHIHFYKKTRAEFTNLRTIS